MARRPFEPRLTTVNGRRKWYVEWCDGSRRTHRRSTGVEIENGCLDPDNAPVAAQQALEAFIEARDTPGADITIGELLDARLADLRARLDPVDESVPKSRRPSYRYATVHKWVRDDMGHLRADQLTRSRLTRFGRDNGWRRMVGRAFTELKAAFKHAGLTAPDFPRMPSRPPRDHFIAPEEAERLVSAAGQLHMQVFLVIAFLSGQRRGAILDLTWDRVDLNSGIANFQDPSRATTQKPRAIVALDPRALSLLREAYEVARTDYIVEYNGHRVHDIKKSWHSTCRAAGLMDDSGKPLYTVHHIKHTVISWLAESGWDIDRIADFTNTTRDTVARIYRKVRPEATKDMSSTLGNKLFGESRRP